MNPPTGRFAQLMPVDSDTHYSEPHDLWTSRAPAKFRDRVPRAEFIDGKAEEFWILDGHIPMFHANGHSFVNRAGEKEPYYDSDITAGKPWEEIHPASYDVAARLEFMDHEGVWAQIVYPNVIAFALGTLLQVDHQLASAVVAIYNDAMAEWQAASNGRLYPQAMVPFWDMKQAIRECERVKNDLHLTGIILAGEPNLG